MSAPRASAAEEDASRSEDWRVILGSAAEEVFSMMVGVELTIPEQTEAPMLTEMAGIVGLAGDLCGIVTIRCSASAATQIASRMLGVSAEEAGAHCGDAVGEISTLVAGHFKAKIGLEDKCMLSVPTVITGASYKVHSLTVAKQIELRRMLNGEAISFALEVSKSEPRSFAVTKVRAADTT
jgi:CheY-specific phosphatase CheX